MDDRNKRQRLMDDQGFISKLVGKLVVRYGRGVVGGKGRKGTKNRDKRRHRASKMQKLSRRANR